MEITEFGNLHNQQLELKEKIYKAKRELNNQLRKDYRWLFRICDILIVLMILSNIGAVVLTNAIAIKNHPETKIVEANPVAAERYELLPATSIKPKQQVYGWIMAFFLEVIVFAAIVSYYVYKRFHIIYRNELFYLMIWAFGVFTFLFMDFANDLGLYIGKMIWGA